MNVIAAIDFDAFEPFCRAQSIAARSRVGGEEDFDGIG
mgnify:FL=1|jgi:hypothetical protein